MRPSIPFVALPLVILVAAVAQGCATPAPIVRLEPRTANNVVWVSGRPVLHKELGGVRVAAAFEHQGQAGLGVRVEVENLTSAPFDVSPDGITFMSCPTTDNGECTGSWSVVDPEHQLDGLDEAESRTVANATNTAALNTSLVLLSAVSDVGAIATGHADANTGVRTAVLGGNAEADAANANASLGSIAGQRDLWSNVALRRSTIEPGRGISGIVYLPIDLKAQYIWIHVRAGGQIFPFGFRQTVRQIRYDGTGTTANPG